MLKRCRKIVKFALALAAACVAASPSWAVDSLTLRLDWNWWIGQAPFFVAREKGYYKDANLDVAIEQGQGSATTAVIVGEGKDPIGHVSLGTAAQSVANGVPITAIAAIIQKGPLGIICDASLNIKTPEQLKGRIIGSTPNGADAAILQAFEDRHGLTDKVSIVNMPGDAKFAAIMTGKVDCISGDGPFYGPQMQAKGKTPNVLYFADWGIPVLSYGLIANPDYVAAHSDIVQRFVTATLKGEEYTYGHIPEAVQIFQKATNDTQSPDFHAGVLEFYKSQFHTDHSQGKPLGWSAKEDWEGMLQALDIAGKVPVEKYYTNKFVGG